MIIIKKRNVYNFLVFFAIILIIVFSFFFYYKLNKTKEIVLNDKEVEKNVLISKVSELYLFPEGETPTVATVSDPELLKNQSLFLTSEKGDNVLIFLKSRKAVLYRPSLNKIIEIVSVKN